MTTILVTGTGTGVGKTTVAAAVALLAVDRGDRVVVVKPAQTGVPDGGGGDLTEILRRVPHVRILELARYPDPLSPAAAARRARRPALTLDACIDAITAVQPDSDVVLVEGAGGLLVPFGDDGFTIADLATWLALPVLLVTEAGLGTLNATALTLEVMHGRGLRLQSLVIGAWPHVPGLAERSNVADLEALAGQPLGGVLPAGAGALDASTFAGMAREGLGPVLGGVFDAAAFRRRVPP